MSKTDKIEITGYDFKLDLSMIGAMSAGIEPGDISTDDLLIFDSFIRYTTWATNAEKRIYNRVIYYHYPWQMVAKRIPYLRAQGRTAIKNKMQNLVKVDLLRAHPKNKELAKPFYGFGAKYPSFVNVKPVRKSGQHLYGKADSTCTEKRTAPVRKSGQHLYGKADDSILSSISSSISSSILNCIFLEKEFKKHEKFKALLINWFEYLSKKKRPVKDQDQATAILQNMIDVSGGNLREAKKIVTQAKASGGINLMPLLGQPKRVSENDFPEGWDKGFFENLATDQITNYWTYLRKKGFKPVRHQGKIIKWAIPQKTV